MISRIEGELVGVDGSCARVQCGSLTYDVLVPACDSQRLHAQVGRPIAFDTLHYLEGQGQGASYTPRLIGFASAEQRAFFELFTTVKGLGNRRALRALQLPFGDVARAIAEKDSKMLVSLPEIGKRLAETIIAELSGKVDRFVDEPVGGRAMDEPAGPQAAMLRDALAVMTMLGEPRHAARQLLDRALAADPDIESPDALVSAAYRLKELV